MCRCKRERAGQPGVFGLNEIAMNGNTFAAPWGKSLRFMSWFSAALGLIIPGAVYLADKNGQANWLPVGCLYWGIMFVTALFVVRSYTIEPDALAIRRLLWTTRVPLAGLQSATFTPDVMRRSLRLFGNGGMFSMPLRGGGTGRVAKGNLQGATNGVEPSAKREVSSSSVAGTAQAARRAMVVPWRELKPVGTGFRLDRPALAYPQPSRIERA